MYLIAAIFFFVKQGNQSCCVRPLAFKSVCMSVQIRIYDDQHKVSYLFKIHIRRTNRRTTCSSGRFVHLLL